MKKETARRLVRDALKRGDLVRPNSCERCGISPNPASDGRSQIHGHHHDYDNPLDVEWICAACHRAETPLPKKIGAPSFGERNGQSKLTEVQVREILLSPIGCRRLGKFYGVHKSTIQRVRQGIRWSKSAAPSPARDLADD
jgi:hypothetical protein